MIEYDYMSDINDIINDNDVDVLSEYFEVVEEDVYYTFKGKICSQLKGGVKNVLYGKRVNLNVLYNLMMDDIISMITTGEFFKGEYLNKLGYGCLVDSVIMYTSKKYGVSLEWMDKIVNNRIGALNNDRLYECMIDRVGGIEKIDWMKVYDSINMFTTHNDDILMYIAKEILKNDIYKYFVDRYKLRVTGTQIKNSNRQIVSVGEPYTEKSIKLEWDGGKLSVPLAKLIKNKKEWWRQATMDSRKRRGDIQDYDVLLNGRCEVQVLPDVCVIDNSIILNYTRIDFSVNNDNNITECKRHDGMDGEKTWSAASIDRIDSNREYDYDNIEIISNYYNTQVKNCASITQIGKLYYYQLHRLLGSKINKDGIKTMSDSKLDKIFDDLGVYVNIIEIVHEYRKLLFKELNKRDKKKSKLKLVDPGEIG